VTYRAPLVNSPLRPAGTIVLALALAGMLAGCANPTQLSTSWKDPATTGPLSFKKVVVVVLNTTPGGRRAQEDTLVGQIKKAQGIPSYSLVSDAELDDRELVKRKIIESGADGAAVMRIMDARREDVYIPGTTSYWGAGGGYGVYNPGHYMTNTIVRAEVSLYSVPDGKLLWVGSSETSNPQDPKDFATNVARAAGAELRKQGLLQ
jgi:hypothetical protein